MNINEIKELMLEFSNLNLSYFEVKRDQISICLKKEIYQIHPVDTLSQANVSKNPTQANHMCQSQQTNVVESAFTAVKSPVVGVFYHSSQPGAAPFVTVGTKVNKGQVLCLIEAMKVISEVPSPVTGVVKRIAVENEQLVAYGETLFEIEE